MQQHVQTASLKLLLEYIVLMCTYFADLLILQTVYGFPRAADNNICSRQMEMNRKSWGLFLYLDSNVFCQVVFFTAWQLLHIYTTRAKWISLMAKFIYFINRAASYKVNKHIARESSSASWRALVRVYSAYNINFFFCCGIVDDEHLEPKMQIYYLI